MTPLFTIIGFGLIVFLLIFLSDLNNKYRIIGAITVLIAVGFSCLLILNPFYFDSFSNLILTSVLIAVLLIGIYLMLRIISNRNTNKNHENSVLSDDGAIEKVHFDNKKMGKAADTINTVPVKKIDLSSLEVKEYKNSGKHYKNNKKIDKNLPEKYDKDGKNEESGLKARVENLKTSLSINESKTVEAKKPALERELETELPITDVQTVGIQTEHITDMLSAEAEMKPTAEPIAEETEETAKQAIEQTAEEAAEQTIEPTAEEAAGQAEPVETIVEEAAKPIDQEVQTAEEAVEQTIEPVAEDTEEAAEQAELAAEAVEQTVPADKNIIEISRSSKHVVILSKVQELMSQSKYNFAMNLINTCFDNIEDKTLQKRADMLLLECYILTNKQKQAQSKWFEILEKKYMLEASDKIKLKSLMIELKAMKM